MTRSDKACLGLRLALRPGRGAGLKSIVIITTYGKYTITMDNKLYTINPNSYRNTGPFIPVRGSRDDFQSDKGHRDRRAKRVCQEHKI